MSSNTVRLIAPPQEEDIYPYRRVWTSILVEVTILSTIAIVFFILASFLNIRFEGTVREIGIIILAILPALLWLLFSFLPERRAPQPRPKLMLVFIVTLLVANAVGIPITEFFFSTRDWLAQGSAVNRIIGYAVTYGATQELLKYLVVRYSVWQENYRIRSDSIAYCVTSAIAYAVIMNFQFISANPTVGLDIVSARVLLYVAIHVAGSLIISYGLSESALSNSPLILLPFTFLVGAFVSGGAIAMRSSVHSGGLDITLVTTRPLFSLAFTLIIVYASILAMFFLYNVADKRDDDLRGTAS